MISLGLVEYACSIQGNIIGIPIVLRGKKVLKSFKNLKVLLFVIRSTAL